MKSFWAFVCLILCACASLTAQISYAAQTWSEEKLAAEELYARFGDEKDEISMQEAVNLLHKLVNDVRRSQGLKALSWDYTAAKAAQMHTEEMAKFRYLSHFNLLGEKPIQRYNRLGGTNQVSENVSYRESSLKLYLTPQLVKDIHERWMQSPPHRKNLLTPTHNTVGIALSLRWDGSRSVLTAAQEFVGDYGIISKLPQSAAMNERLDLHGQFSNKNIRFEYLGVGWEPFPEKQSPKELNASLNGYSLPKPFIVLMAAGDEHLRSVEGLPSIYKIAYHPSSGRYLASLSVREIYSLLKEKTGSGKKKPGLYYFMLWVSQPEGQPFLASTQVVQINN